VGYVEDVKKAAEKCAAALKETGAGTIVVLDENDAVFMKHQWAEWGIECGQIVTATSCIASLIKDGKLEPAAVDLTACYHDPARIARDLEEWEPARAIIAAMGIELHELFHNKKGTKSTGGGMLHQTSPKIAAQVAEARMNDIRFAEESVVITSTPTAFDNLSSLGAEDVEVKDLFILLNDAC
jgi:Fe-S oxidoreductase